jgi:hypothetical protein
MAMEEENSLEVSKEGDEDASQDFSGSEREQVEIEIFQEDEDAVAMAQEEERMLRELMDKQRASMGVRDSMLDDAIVIMEKVEVERHNDHGKPWKAPPPVAFSTEYWKEWRDRVKVDKSNVETPEEKLRRERLAELEKRKNRPSIRAPLPTKKDRHGIKKPSIANFSQKFYNEMKDPRVPPKKAEKRKKLEENRAIQEVRHMMRTFGVDDVNADRLEDSISKPPRIPDIPRPVGFSTGTRDDWNKVISVGKSPYGNQGGKGNAPPTQYDVQTALSATQKKGPTPIMLGRPSDKSEIKKTPGPIYEPKLTALSNKIHTREIQFSSNPRFKVAKEKPGGEEPGPTTYKLPPTDKKTIVLPFNGMKEFDYGEKEKAPNLRAMRNFGHGCNLQEHILYGQCLDGKCSSRGFWEKRNTRKIGHWRKKEKTLKVAGEEKKDAEKTALHFAVIYRDQDLVHKLCLDGLNVDAVDEDNKTPLHIACEKGLTRITERLLNNADFPLIVKVGYVSKRINPLIDEQDMDGHTPLHLASIGAHRKCCELLIDAGANPDVLNNEGMTALDVAGTQALFQALEYYSEMSMERARTESINMQTVNKIRQQDEYAREQERQQYRVASNREKMMKNEMNNISMRGKTLLMEERSFIENSSR